MYKITQIKSVDKEKVIHMNEKIYQAIQEELGKMYSENNVAEYRFLSRLYTNLSSRINKVMLE